MKRTIALISAAAPLVAATLLGVGPAARAATPQTTSGGPYPAGTTFFADTGMREPNGFPDGALYELPPTSGGATELEGGNTQDVAVDSAGDVFFTSCNGYVGELHATGGYTTFADGLNCANGIGIEPNGDVLVSDFYHIYRFNPDGSGQTQIDNEEASSIAVDGNDDIYIANGSDQLAVMLDGAGSPIPIRTPWGATLSVRLDDNDGLTVGTTSQGVVEQPAGTVYPPDYIGTDLGFADGASPDGLGDVVVAERATNKVYRVAADGSTESVAQSGLDSPDGVATYPAPQPAARAASTVSVSSPNDSDVTTFQHVRLNATVASSGNPSGYVQFEAPGGPLGNPVKVVDGLASFTHTLPAGSTDVTALYLGDTANAPSLSPTPVSFTVSPILTHTTIAYTGDSTLTDNGNQAVPSGSPAQFTATVTPVGNHAVKPSGDVDFSAAGNFLGSAQVGSDGTATASIQLSPGLHKVVATYDGDGYYKSSASAALPIAVIKPFQAQISLSAGVAQNPGPGGNRTGHITVTLVGTKAPGLSSQPPAPTGLITADWLGMTCTPLAPSGHLDAVSHCTGSKFPQGDNYVTITYSGDAGSDGTSDGEGWYASGNNSVDVFVPFIGGGCGDEC